ncbi:MAG: tetratricopeptide repeat protein [Bacteroidales bacterium]|nr:tetratricopeptide repeat protein [Bacteroidales bacterium]
MKKIASLMLAAVLFVACGPNREKLLDEIRTFEELINESPISAANPETADSLTDLYVSFADKFEQDSLSPAFLLKAGEVQSNVLHTEHAVEIFDRLIENYPDFEDLPMCYYLKANAYDMNSQYEEAKAAYEFFVSKYPDHFMARAAQISLDHLGMSPEEMLADILAHADDTIIAQNNETM